MGKQGIWADYPLRASILDIQWNRTPYGTVGAGHGNLQEGSSIHGFEYTFSCPAPFMATQGNSYYPARWKKDQRMIELRVTEIGNKDHVSECELKLSQSDFVYTMRDGHLVTIAQAQLRTLLDSLQPKDLNVANYPLRFTLLQSHWVQADPGLSGWGKGNLHYQDGAIRGVEFSSLCSMHLEDSGKGEAYPARLDEATGKLTILAHAIGESNYSRTCEFKTALKTFIFVRTGSQAITTMTQEEFQKRVALQAKPTLAELGQPE